LIFWMHGVCEVYRLIIGQINSACLATSATRGRALGFPC
jgi:hypothetical protein